MAKKFGKFVLGLTTAVAAGAGVYYLLKKKYESEPEDEFDDDFEDEDFELDDDLGEVAGRGYVSLTPSSDSKEETEPAEVEEPADTTEKTATEFDKAVEKTVAETKHETDSKKNSKTDSDADKTK